MIFKTILRILIVFLSFDIADAKVCKPKIIKSYKEINEKLKICDKGDKLLLMHDVKVDSKELILKLCDLKFTVITDDEINVIQKRQSGISIVCIYSPDF
ncbi:MAG: hypothetical protein CMN01_02615 [Rickettsiales bacterium]|nr:hypothetical protein [Rickettsiales bacterium]|tara:strand:+ start:2256 stop:2552 length:297 start_codon:yes stop_codon:yes gene_type:complete